jgi:ketosteroid isomerase-like protein
LPPRAALQAGVDSAANRVLTALRSNAPDSLLALLTDDVAIMPPNEPALRGKAAVRAWYEHFLTRFRTSSLTVINREVFVGDDWAADVAGYEWTLNPVAGGPSVIDRGSYMQIWRRETDGRWLFSREVWNSTTPLSASSQAP